MNQGHQVDIENQAKKLDEQIEYINKQNVQEIQKKDGAQKMITLKFESNL